MTSTVSPAPLVGGDRVESCARPKRRVTWRDDYARRLLATDILVLLVAVAVAPPIAHLLPGGPGPGHLRAMQVPASACVLVGWAALLAWAQSRDGRVVASGADEYQRVVNATVRGFGLLAVAALWFRVDVARAYLVVALPLGLAGLIVTRWGWRRWLDRQHRRGRCVTRVVVLGDPQAARDLAARFDRDRSHAFRVVGVCVPADAGAPAVTADGGVPVLGDEASVAAAVERTGADTVAVTATERLGDARLHELAWELADLGVALTVSPGVTEIAAERLRITPASAVPLLHIEEPQYRGAGRMGKMFVDRIGAAAALVVLSPVLAACVIAVLATSRGPVFYRAERIGIDGRPFTMVKFRSMVDGADRMRSALEEGNDGAGPLFKLREDPRVTRVGRVLRRCSLDELPQLINVLRGEMSLVGPRPPLRCEVETYTGAVRRRLLVRPGITGLWQISGRSDLPWDEAVRLDLSYVENWSMMGDLVIIWRTVRAVASGAGAY